MISGVWIGWYYLIGNGNDGVVINAGWTGIIVIRQNSAHHCYKVGKMQHLYNVAHVSLKQNLTRWQFVEFKKKKLKNDLKKKEYEWIVRAKSPANIPFPSEMYVYLNAVIY